jgi:hypothetical protein
MLKTIAIAVAALLGVLLLGNAVGWFSLFAARPMAGYAEETRAQTYDKSRQFNQGTNRDIARYCRDMRTATGAAAKATATLIISTADTFEGELNQGNRDCVAEAKGL